MANIVQTMLESAVPYLPSNFRDALNQLSPKRLLSLAIAFGSTAVDPRNRCPGYVASNLQRYERSLTADLELAGEACNVYGRDIPKLTFSVECQTRDRLHVQIFDPAINVYQVPESVFSRPTDSVPCDESELEVTIQQEPFSFSIRRKMDGDTIFDSAGTPLIFEDQYWRLRTALPDDPNLYGIGEHTDSLRLNTTDYVRTIWNRDAGGVPEGQNLYGAHPVYFEKRAGVSHGVALLSSNGMDVKIDRSTLSGQYLEYNVLGGIVDLFFLAGPEPVDVAKQYSQVSGKPAMVPYWSLGFHNCRYGYRSAEELAEVVSNYSQAGIPLETMWTDIDYMDGYKVFTLAPKFPLEQMRALVDHLHSRGQHYVVMVDPAVAYKDYDTFNRGRDAGVFLRNEHGGIYQAVVWPGVAAYPDWFHKDVQTYWDREFAEFFHPEKSIDIDALWIDMNEPANFCEYPCVDPEFQASESTLAASREPGEQIPLTLIDQADEEHPASPNEARYFCDDHGRGLPKRNLLDPKYRINNYVGVLSNHTANTSIIHANGLTMYDTHNLYGTMMSSVSHETMLKRRPTRRALVITRSTFMGAGKRVGHWLGDNRSTWHHYRQSIRHLLQFTAFFQMPMVGADICGFDGDTTEELCARWARLGAFYPFMRNHNGENSISQEFYRWPRVAESARKALDLRYRLLDYLYTAMYIQSVDGTPALTPLWMMYPDDAQTAANEHQFFYGPALLISPVTEESSTTAEIYLPKNEIFYSLDTLERIQGGGSYITVQDVETTDIPVHVRGGHIVPMRVESANTTTELRKKDFELLVAPDARGRAEGVLYLDDGDSLVQKAVSTIAFVLRDGVLEMDGEFGFENELRVVSATVLVWDDDGSKERVVKLDWPLTRAGKVEIRR